MIRFLEIFGFLSVLLRGATLSFQSLTVGGVIFLTLVAGALRVESEAARGSCLRWIRRFAIALVVTQVAYVLTNGVILAQSADLTIFEIAGANFAIAGIIAALSALTIAILARTERGERPLALLLPAALILAGGVMTSHAVARIEDRVLLIILATLHQGATAAWIGGLPYLLISLKNTSEGATAQALTRRFSRLAMFSVVTLASAGLAMSYFYVGSWAAVPGTSYGAMVASKVAMLGFLLVLGALNYKIVHAVRNNSQSSLASLRRFGEVEIGIGLTVILAAASLTSQPPAVDIQAGRVTLPEIAARMAPRVPRMKSPSASDLPTAIYENRWRATENTALPESFVPGQAAVHPNTPAEKAWSEYNHHWAGLFVLVIGILALAARTGYAEWARNWPLVFFALAAFLSVRSDPENWPLGPNGFWESFADPEVFQHRVSVLLVIAFAIFEWGVQTGRMMVRRAELVFPLVGAVGGALLLTHSHSLGNLKEELLAELSHIPLALCAVLAGWSRWLEMRLPSEDRTRNKLSWIWPVCFILIGIILLNYRES
jgi:putative copper resistance protein D